MTKKMWWWEDQQLDQTIAGSFEGGGLKGHAFTGALEAVVESGRWFHAVSGASSGAAVSALIAAGLPPESGREFLADIAPRYLSANWWEAITQLGTTGGVFQQQEIIVAYELLMQQSVRGTRIDNPTAYSHIFGDHPMDGCHPITFAEMYAATGIELHVSVTNISHARAMVFNYKTAPNVSVSQAVFASTALPIAFVPPLITHDDNMERMETAVDGGVWANMPRFVYETPYRQGVQLPPLPENVKLIGFLLSDAQPESDNELSTWLEHASFERRPKQAKHWRIFPRHSQTSMRERFGWAHRAIILITLLAIPALSIPLSALYDLILNWLGNGRTTIPLIVTAASIIAGSLALWRGTRRQTGGAWVYVVTAAFITFLFALSTLFVDSHFLVHPFVDRLPTTTTLILIAITALIFLIQFALLTNKRTWAIKPLIPVLFAIGIASFALILFLTGYIITDLFNGAVWRRIISMLVVSAFFFTMFYSYLTILSAAPLRSLVLAINHLFAVAGNPNRATKNDPNVIALPIPAHLGTISITWRGVGLDVPQSDIDKMVDDGRAITQIRLVQIFDTLYNNKNDKPQRTVGVFGSGGVQGVAYIGAIKEMEQRDIQFEAVAGVGAGALMAAFIAAGYRSDELADSIGRFLAQVTSRPLKLTPSWFISYLFRSGNWSIVDTNNLLHTINRELAEKIDIDRDIDITFSMLFAATNIELNILSIDLTHHEPLVFNHINTPNCQVADAILASYAYPLLISPPLLTTTLPHADLPHRLLFDGSIADTLPTFIFEQLDQTYNNHIYAFTLAAENHTPNFYNDHNAYRMARFDDITFHYIGDPDPKKGQYPYEWGDKSVDGQRWKSVQTLRGRWPDPEQWTPPPNVPTLIARFFDAAAIASKLFQQIFHPAFTVIIALITVAIGITLINACLPHDMVIMNALFDTDWQLTRLMRVPFILLLIATAVIITGAFTLLFALAKLFRIMIFSFGRTFGYGARLQWWEAADTPTKTIFTIHTGNISPFGFLNFDDMDASEIEATIKHGRAAVQSQSENLHIV